jgi:hypothetical protein
LTHPFLPKSAIGRLAFRWILYSAFITGTLALVILFDDGVVHWRGRTFRIDWTFVAWFAPIIGGLIAWNLSPLPIGGLRRKRGHSGSSLPGA